MLCFISVRCFISENCSAISSWLYVGAQGRHASGWRGVSTSTTTGQSDVVPIFIRSYSPILPPFFLLELSSALMIVRQSLFYISSSECSFIHILHQLGVPGPFSYFQYSRLLLLHSVIIMHLILFQDCQNSNQLYYGLQNNRSSGLHSLHC